MFWIREEMSSIYNIQWFKTKVVKMAKKKSEWTMTSLKTKKNTCFKKTVTLVTLPPTCLTLFFFCVLTHEAAFFSPSKCHWRSNWIRKRQQAISASETKSAIGASLFLFSPTQSDAQLKLPRTSPVRCALSPRPHLALSPKTKATVEGWNLHERDEEYSLHDHRNLEDQTQPQK